MDLYYLIVFFIFGLIFGSFYNVVGYRLPNNMSLISPSSHCPKCNHKLTALELIPVFSYLFQGGKCKNCKCKIAIFYPIFELFTGIVFAIIYKVFGISIDTFIALVFASMLLIIMISDILYMIIPDELLIFCGVVILILRLVSGAMVVPLVIDMVIPFLVLLLIKVLGDKAFKRESMGGGDIKLMLIFGMVLGWELSIFTIVLAAFIALPITIVMNAITKNSDHELPFGPYLSIAALICLLTRVDIMTILHFFGI